MVDHLLVEKKKEGPGRRPWEVKRDGESLFTVCEQCRVTETVL